jgi:hypothetical protein
MKTVKISKKAKKILEAEAMKQNKTPAEIVRNLLGVHTIARESKKNKMDSICGLGALNFERCAHRITITQVVIEEVA